MRRLSTVGALVVALALVGEPALAAALAEAPSHRDVVAARSVLSAVARFERAAVGRESAQTAAAKAEVAQVQVGCAGAIPASAVHGTATQQSVVQDLLAEGSLDVSLAVEKPVARAASRLDTRLSAAAFSSRALTGAIHRSAKLEERAIALEPTNLCADVQAAAAAKFASESPPTTSALRHIASLSSPHTLGPSGILKQLGPYLVSARDRASLAGAKAAVARFQRFTQDIEFKWEGKLTAVLDK